MVIIPTHEGGCKSMIIKPYKGNDSYLFISYAHKDRVTAMSIIERMINAGYRVWYDEGIDPGTEWDGNIASHLRSCDGIIALLSRNYLASENCKDELNFARDLGKDRLLVYLEEVELPDGMAMRLGRNLAIHRSKYPEPDSFFEKLTESPMVARNRAGQYSDIISGSVQRKASYVPPRPAAASSVKPSVKQPPKPPLGRALGIALGVLMILALLAFFRSREQNRPDPTASAAPTASSAGITVSAADQTAAAPASASPTAPLSADVYTGSRSVLSELTVASAAATSSLKDEVYGEFPARNVLDNDISTSWQEGVTGYGLYESLKLTFSSEQELRYLEVYNGNQSNEWSYLHNGRIKTALLGFSDGSSCEFSFSDEPGSTIIALSRSVRTSYVEITILDVYKAAAADDGVEYTDTSISEVHLYT